MKKHSITPTDRLVFAYLVDYKTQHNGDSPNLGEISENCHMVRQYVPTILRKLEAFGYIRLEKRKRNRQAAIHIPGSAWHWSGQATPLPHRIAGGEGA